jgi:hypothetical protein
VKIKESYNNATLKNLLKKVPGFKRYLIWYFVFLLVAVISLASIMWDNSSGNSLFVIFKPIILSLVPVGFMIYILMSILPKILIDHYSYDKFHKLKTYKKGWRAARYQLFKESLSDIDFKQEGTLDRIYEYIKEEKDFPKETLWDHKFFVTYITFLMIGWAGIVKELSNSDAKSILVGIFSISLLLVLLIWMILSAIPSDNEKHKELKLFISWYECELESQKDAIEVA